MLRPRWLKVLSDLWSNKIRTLLVIASIGIGLFAVGLITNMYIIILDDMRVGYEAINPANIQISTSPFNSDLVDRLENMEGIAQAEGANLFTLSVKTKTGKFDPIQIKGYQDIEDSQINQVSVLEGKWPPGDHEIVIDHYRREDIAAQIGEQIEVELPSGKVRQLTLVGIIMDQSIGSTDSGGFFLAPVQGYINRETVIWLEQPDMLNHIYATLSEDYNDDDHLRHMANRVNEEIEDNGQYVYSSSIRPRSEHPNYVYILAISSTLFLLGFLVMFLSAFLITNTLSALLNQQNQQIGIMKSVGARRDQIILVYMVLIFIFGIIAFAIAAPLSSRAAYTFLEFLGAEVNMQLQGYRAIPLATLLQLIIALVVPQAAGFMPILHGTRISVAEAFSGFSAERPPSQKNLVDRSIGRLRGISRPLLISLRNTFRRKGRLALTLFTLTLGGAIFIATFNVQGSLDKHINRIGQYFLADVNLTMSYETRIDKLQKVVMQVPGVKMVEGWAVAGAEVVMPDGKESESISLLGPPSSSTLVEPILLEGRWITEGDVNAIALSELFYDLLPGLEPGDTLRLKILGEEVDLTVVGFFQLAGQAGGYMGYTTYEFLAEHMGTMYQARAFRILAEGSNLTMAEQEDLVRLIEIQLREQGFQIDEITPALSLTDKTTDGLSVLTGFLLVMATLTALVGSIGLAGTMSLNVLERTREIGITRAIGASDRAVTNLVLVEGVLIGFLSWLFGAALSIPISLIMSNIINLSIFGAPAAFTFTPTGVIVWLVVVLLLSMLASVMPARNAARLTIREVLAYE